jgi:hypothetical protein
MYPPNVDVTKIPYAFLVGRRKFKEMGDAEPDVVPLFLMPGFVEFQLFFFKNWPIIFSFLLVLFTAFRA